MTVPSLLAAALCLAIGSTFTTLAHSQPTDCTPALIKATYSRMDMSNSDWRVASLVSEKDYEEIKRDAGVNATIYGIPMGATYADFQKRVRETTNNYSASLTQSQATNVLWTGLNAASSNAYSECLRTQFGQYGLHLGVRSATKDEVAVLIVWNGRNSNNAVRLEWQWSGDGKNKLPKSVVVGERVVVLTRPTQQQMLAVNYKGYTDSLIIEPYPADPIVVIKPPRYESFLEEYESPEQTGWGTNFSQPYTLCTPEKPPGWTIEKVDLRLESTRERNACKTYTTCGGNETDTPTRACRTTSVQGHTDNKYSGYGTMKSVIKVQWRRPVPQ